MWRNCKALHLYLLHNWAQSMFCQVFISPHSTRTVLTMLIIFGIQVPTGILYKLVYFLTHFLRWPDPAHTTLITLQTIWLFLWKILHTLNVSISRASTKIKWKYQSFQSTSFESMEGCIFHVFSEIVTIGSRVSGFD